MVRDDLLDFLKTIPNNVTLVAATKYADIDDMKMLFNNGATCFGENRVESFLNKHQALSSLDVEWHFIGHLQRNKARKVLAKINYLHSLDSLELADLINKTRSTPLKCFVEVSINLEENKYGVPFYKVKDFIRECLKYQNVQIVGLMMMGIANSYVPSLHDQFRKLK